MIIIFFPILEDLHNGKSLTDIFQSHVASQLQSLVDMGLETPASAAHSYLSTRTDGIYTLCDHDHSNKWNFGKCDGKIYPMRSQPYKSHKGVNPFEDKKFNKLLTSGYVAYNQTSGARVLYHVTTVANCHNILKTGVRLARCGDHKDFYDKQGFYLHTSYDGAKEFISTRQVFFENVAIIRFEVDLDTFIGTEIKGTEWYKVIPACRKWSPDDDDIKILKKYAKYDFLEGPIARLTPGDYDYKNIFPHTYNQLCVRSDGLADNLSDHVTGVMFFFTHIRN